jgi:hypothetical protein
MSYTRPPASTLAGRALKQTPVPSTQAIVPVVLDADIASTTQLGVVKIGSGISVAVDGTISASGGGSYEIGTWVPQLVGSVAGTIVLNRQNAKYIKTGQGIMCTFDITVTSIIDGNKDSVLTLTGLPYTSITDTGYVGSLYVSYFQNMNTNIDYLGGTVVSNTKNALLWCNTEQSKSLDRLVQNNIKSTARLVGTINYVTQP